MDKEEIRLAFYYDPTSPSCLRWNIEIRSGRWLDKINTTKGAVAGSIGADGYFTVTYRNKAWKVHRIIAALHGLNVDNLFVDHIDRNKTNNRIENLRVVSRAVNNRNHSGRKTNHTGVNGVYYCSRDDAYVATWYDHQTGRRHTKNFSCRKYGPSALLMAEKFRISILSQMNLDGAQYAEHLVVERK